MLDVRLFAASRRPLPTVVAGTVRVTTASDIGDSSTVSDITAADSAATTAGTTVIPTTPTSGIRGLRAGLALERLRMGVDPGMDVAVSRARPSSE